MADTIRFEFISQERIILQEDVNMVDRARRERCVGHPAAPRAFDGRNRAR